MAAIVVVTNTTTTTTTITITTNGYQPITGAELKEDGRWSLTII